MGRMPNNPWHVVPESDSLNGATFVHVNQVECACNPRVEWMDEGAVVVHNAFDKREIIEVRNTVEYTN